jgi:hypothetical protein
MATINLQNNRQVIDYLARDYESFRQALIGLIPAKLPEWQDRSEADFGIVLIELLAYMGDILSYYQDRIANEAFLGTARERANVIQHLRLIGYELAGAAPAAARLSILAANNATGTVEVRPGDQFATVSTPERPSKTFEFLGTKPLVIDLNKLPPSAADPTLNEALDFIPVSEGRTVTSEVIGVSDGTPNQRYPLANPNAIGGTVQIVMDTVPPTAPWSYRKNLVFSRPAFTPEQLATLEYQDRIASTLAFSRGSDPDFSLETDENEITTVVFGDGEYGMIPPTGVNILASYRAGGGLDGNAGAGQITVISKAPQLQLAGVRVINRTAASGGDDPETIDHAVQFAPTVFTSMNRAVTAQDYVAQALLYPGVFKARATPTNWNTVTLYIAPAGAGEAPSDILRQGLLQYFEDRRMLTAFIEVASPAYVPLAIDVEVGAAPYVRSADIQASSLNTIQTLYAYETADFAQTLFVSKLYELLQSQPGVSYVVVNNFSSKPGFSATAQDGRIVLGENQIATLDPADITLTVTGGVQGGAA